MKKYVKYITIAVILFAIIWAISAYISAKNAPLKVTTEKVQRKGIITEITSNGKIQPKKSYELTTPATGKIAYMPFEEGDEVTKGTVLVILDEIDAKEQTNKAWADYKISLEKIREFENNNKDKPKDDKYIISYNQLASQRDGYAAIVAQNIALQRNRVLVSPINGAITQINKKPGELASSAQTIIAVADLNDLEFVAEVDEQDTGKLAPNQKATLRLDAFADQEFTGEVREISKVAKINSTGGTYYPTKLNLFNKSSFIRVGMNGDATVQTEQKNGILTLPTEAVLEEENKKFVFTVLNGTAHKTLVETGIQNDTDIEIRSGLNEGDVVITTEQEKIKEGSTVQ
jgi:HlyD family secretion protein